MEFDAAQKSSSSTTTRESWRNSGPSWRAVTVVESAASGEEGIGPLPPLPPRESCWGSRPAGHRRLRNVPPHKRHPGRPNRCRSSWSRASLPRQESTVRAYDMKARRLHCQSPSRSYTLCSRVRLHFQLRENLIRTAAIRGGKFRVQNSESAALRNNVPKKSRAHPGPGRLLRWAKVAESRDQETGGQRAPHARVRTDSR